MEPRGYFGTWGLLFGVTSLPFGLTFSILMYLWHPINFGEVLFLGIFAGLFFGISFGSIMAFFLQVRTISIPFKNKNNFLQKLNLYLAQIGYVPESETNYIMTFKPSFQAGLLAGKISTQLQKEDAIIVGPSMYVNKLHNKIVTN